MHKSIGLLLLCFAASMKALYGQSSVDVEKTFRDDIVHKRFFLKSMSADSETDYRWDGESLVLTPPKLHTIAVFLPAKVMVTSDKILIEGSRKTLVSPKADSYLLVGDSSAFLSIALNGGPADQVLPFLVDQLFLPTLRRRCS